MKLISSPSKSQPASQSAARSKNDPTGQPVNWMANYLFSVSIEGVVVGLFTECGGIGAKRSVEPYREGGSSDHVNLYPGPIEYDHITLKRGLSLSMVLWDWFSTGSYDYKVIRHTVTITQAAPAAAPGQGHIILKTWTVKNAFPVSWKLSELSASSSSLAIETLELAHEGISLA